MKDLLLSLFLLWVPGTGIAMDKASAAALGAQAESAYQGGDFEQALQLYDSLNSTHTSASLLFNMGNCCFKLERIPQAVLYYERALLLEPGAEDIQANLELAEQRTMDRIASPPAFAMGPSWNRFWGGRDVDSWSRRALWSWTAAMLLGIALLWMRRSSLRNVLLGLCLLLAVVGGASTIRAWTRMKQVASADAGIVMQPRVEVVSEPRADSNVLFVLHAGTKVTILRSNGAWKEISLENGTIGWMTEGAIEQL